VFAAVASQDIDRVRSWLNRWSQRGSPALPSRRCVDGSFACALDEPSRADLANGPDSILVGTMRVEPIRRERVPGARRGAATAPLDAARHLLQERGLSSLGDLVGQFALVLWNRAQQELLAIRDPLGLAPLYYGQRAGALLLADSLDAFEDHAAFDLDYIAQFIATRATPDTTRTIRQGVRALPPGAWLRWRDGCFTIDRYWSVEDLAPLRLSLSEASAEFRVLLHRALKTQIDPGARTWAHLSGGLDSSSVVSTASAIAAHGAPELALGGTITLTDSFGHADERALVDEVVARYGVTNVTIADRWPWQADEDGPPLTDRPSRDYPYFARDRAVARTVTSAGGTAVLSGIGPDLYLPYTAAHCPDLLWTGHLVSAARELHAWTVARRGSLWRVAMTDGVLPLVSRSGPATAPDRQSPISSWFTADFRDERGVDRLLGAAARYAGPRGRYYLHRVAASLSALAERLSSWRYGAGVDVRHPLLHLPLVAFSARLPYTLRTDASWSKPVLRAAMNGIVPERIRTRPTESIAAPHIAWAFRHERDQLQRLLTNPILADLGCIEPRAVRQALDAFDRFRLGEASFLYVLLSLETWLSVKSGRWSAGDRTARLKEHTRPARHRYATSV
jgi:asparagine synthase (glutamine-hydrolysing)